MSISCTHGYSHFNDSNDNKEARVYSKTEWFQSRVVASSLDLRPQLQAFGSQNPRCYDLVVVVLEEVVVVICNRLIVCCFW